MNKKLHNNGSVYPGKPEYTYKILHVHVKHLKKLSTHEIST